ncbi:hypothetical protein DICVIV_03899 [Dictyocaulus viviparus]|uniref:BTB domain-containing protein n=1 Tax=Dictyocaulus viviparus TaxID=29172 RepID=A0A0D8Y1C6_DICVI|nr:hypothetical protein DICVIV_03899 [Dictyocaulus viviparus]
MGGGSSSPCVKKSCSLADLDHRKVGNRDKLKSFRDLICALNIHDVETLFKEFEASRILLLLRSEANSARPKIRNIGEQLFLSNNKDFTLTIDGVSYPIHRRLLLSRCGFVKEAMNSLTSELVLSFPDRKSFSCEELSSFIRYLYTDEWYGNVDVLESLCDWFGCRNDLLVGLKKAEEASLYDGDLTISLISPASLNDHSVKPHLPEFKIRCDSAILSARSAVFHGLLNNFGNSRQIVLDEALLPRGFVPVVMHFLYTDELDLCLISDTLISQSSLSEARAIVAGRSPHSSLHRAIQLIHIAKFFLLEKLVHLCEDIIVASLCQESCVSILAWASDGGSRYVAHCAQSYLEAEFSHIASSHYLFDISLNTLMKCTQSQFTQATEVEILEAVVRWGEHELLRRMEEREPNIVADTSHSISRRGLRRADLSGAELRAILAPIVSSLRIDYVLPPFHQSLNDAYCRGLLERAPLRADLVCPSTSEIIPDIHWFRPEPDVPGPRYYVPYYEITKAHLRNFGQCNDTAHITHSHFEDDCNFQVIVTNLWPDVLCEEKFAEIRTKITTAVESANHLYHICNFPRLFHRRMAVFLITLRVLREMDVDPGHVRVQLASDQKRDPGFSGAEIINAQVFSRSSQNWPDVMMVERMGCFPLTLGTLFQYVDKNNKLVMTNPVRSLSSTVFHIVLRIQTALV